MAECGAVLTSVVTDEVSMMIIASSMSGSNVGVLELSTSRIESSGLEISAMPRG